MKPTGRSEITNGVIWKQLLRFFFPILIGTFFQQLYNTADAIIVGRFASKEGLAAVGATGQITNILVGFFVGLSSGATVVISQEFGANNMKELGKSVHTAVALSLLGGVIITLVGLLASPFALSAMNTPSDIYAEALTYIRTYFAGVIAVLLYNMGSGILRAVGDSKSPLYVLIACCFVNIILDLIFVAALDMGVFGAGLATVLSQVASAALVLAMLMRTQLSYKLYINKIRLYPEVLGKMLHIGLPTGFQSTLYSISNILVQSAVNSFGTDTVAAWTAFGKIDSVFWMILGAFGVSITTFAGQNFGAGKYDRVKKSVRTSLLFAGASSVALSIILYFTCRPLLSLFTTDPAVTDAGVFMLRTYCPFYISFVFIEILSGAIRGCGESVIPMIITAVGVCGLRIAWILIALPIRHTITTILYTYPITWIATSAAFIVYYLFGGWMERCKKH